ncbi:hypothetical protein BJ508DRAFT_217480 [Ascobolus immersus RN42]|uniref:Uncharacterized protein n=1 Tax=Ascobolus immersus RN42 TaxID=1160509 RepID=A0A3N4HC90_ASCIM|nr:hypothetical protein BJ508DRAFT_217480 [Ascobolus immersus RN42]
MNEYQSTKNIFHTRFGTVCKNSKTYSTKDFRVVTHRSTNLAIRSLTMGERTGSRIFFNLWPYVLADYFKQFQTV